MEQWFVYILACEDGAFYTGMTDNLERRLKEHKSGQGGQFTKHKRINDLIYSENFKTQIEAEKREVQLKKWSRAKKEALIQGNLDKLKELSRSKD
jgi:predicted GIY-YIG superfamily endonuclease